ncbi:MAG: SPOR domain-containing protein [Fibrobacterota bacterium]|nr:SPOR domain-containing protein [Fibrobacterota bacterium]QQS03576.1 MAG: SPOR domain-containing protein [Fibrobacterota bacterium]
MTVLAILTTSLLCALPSPSEVRADLDAYPWRPAPAPAVQDTDSKRPTKETVTTAPAPPPAPATASSTKPSPTPTPAPAASTGGTWAIQLVAISNADAARSEQKRLEKIVGGTVDLVVEPPMNKLRWGNFATKEEAEAAKAALKAKSVDGYVVRR